MKTSKQTCTQIQDDLKAYQDHQLPFMQRQRVRRHLSGCAACRKEISAMEQISNEFHAETLLPLEPALRNRILSATLGSQPEAIPTSKPAPRWLSKPVLVWGAASLSLVAWFVAVPLINGEKSVINGGPVASSPMPSSKIAVAHTPQVAMNQEVRRDSIWREGDPNASIPGGMPSGGIQSSAASSPIGTAGGGMLQAPIAGSAITGRSLYNNQTSNHQTEHELDYYEKKRGAGRLETQAQTRVNNYPLPKTEIAGKSVDNLLSVHGDTGFTAGKSRSAKLPATEVAGSSGSDEEAERQVHKEAQITVQVDNVETRSETVEQIARAAGGFVANNQLTTGDDNSKSASLTLKIPVAQFETILGQVAHLGEVKAKNIMGEDLTEKISDQEQSEITLNHDIKATQEQLNHKLSRQGREDRLDTLRELRTRIAQQQARLKLLKRMGALSTIAVELDEKPHTLPPAPKTGGFVTDMNDAMHSAVHSMVQAARLPIMTFIWIIAYAPLWILLILGYRYAVRR